jgi:methyl-accepting chemotaxis protein
MMKAIRRLLGILVMIAGVLGLILSLAGLVTIWVFKPQITSSLSSTIATLDNSITTSKDVMDITGEALGATVTSVDALSTMLETTALTVQDTKPVFTQLNSVMGDTLPQTMEDATTSLKAAQEAAKVLEASMKSFENFQMLASTNPLLAMMFVQPEKPVIPEKPLAESLGDLAKNLVNLPQTFNDMSTNLDKADNNLDAIQTNLSTMSESVSLISKSLGEYKSMIGESKSSMDNLQTMLTSMKNNLPTVLNITVTILTLFFLWLLAVQVVILSQGLELFHGTATTMAAAKVEMEDNKVEVKKDSNEPEN